MEAPDKVFVSSDPFGFMEAYYIENHPPYGEEYIRKDALLEWAKDVKQGLIVEMEKYGAPTEQRIFAFQEFIDKIESL